MLYDTIIIGGGPAGVAAGVYAARKKMRTALITESFGGQSSVSEKIENWIGTIAISGIDLSRSLENHLRAAAKENFDIILGDKIKEVKKIPEGFEVVNESGKTFQAKTVLVTTGSHRRKLQVPGADKFEHKGVTYCASCDGPIFADQDLVVIGGGNAAFDSASQLLAYAKSVTLLNRSENFRADLITIESVSKHPNMKVIKNAIPKEVLGDTFVSGIICEDALTGLIQTISTTGIFVEIGSIPTTSFVENLVELNEYKHIKIDARTQKTSTEGIWAAGDCTDVLYNQNNIAAGDAVKALEDIYIYLHTNRK